MDVRPPRQFVQIRLVFKLDANTTNNKLENLRRTFWQKHVERCIKEFIENNRDVSYADMLIVTTDVRAACQTEYDCSVQIQILERLIYNTSDIRQLYLLRLKLALCRLIMFSKDGVGDRMLRSHSLPTIFEGFEAQMAVDVKAGEDEVTEADKRSATVQEETVTFSDDRQKVTDVRPTDIVRVNNDNPYFTESILQWISRPFPVKTIIWKSSNIIGSRIASIPFPSSLFHIDPLWNKILNFNYFKAGVKVAIRVNGTRFHYGKLLVMWSPQSQNTGVMYQATDNIFSASGFPHVLVSPTESETHEFVMPFAIPFPWINLSAYASTASHHRYFDIGTVYIYVLNPLGVAGNSTVPDVNISIYANFEQPELAGYTMTEWDTPPISTIPAQAFVINPATATFSWTAPSRSEFQLDCKHEKLEAQMAINDVNDAEGAEKSEEGLISGVAERVSGIANLFTRVPLVAPVAGVVGKVAGGIARVARFFGYCNPLSQESLIRMKLHVPFYTHSHGLDNAISLTMTPNAKVSPGVELLGGFPEEQTLAYLCGTPSLLYVQKWLSSDSNSKNLVTIPVSPMMVCKSTDTTGVNEVVCPTVLSFACQPFRYWRGSLRYYITVTCSAFHSGRLKISWTPDYLKSTQNDESYIQVTHILDIQDETDFTFSIPWMKHTLYAPLAKYNKQTDTEQFNGFVTISVVNPLTAPMSPIGDVYINVYVSACDDLQLNFANTEKLYLPMNKLKSYEIAQEIEAQWGVDTRDMPRIRDIKVKRDVINELDSYRNIYLNTMSLIQPIGNVRYPTFYEFFVFVNEIEEYRGVVEDGLEAQFMTREAMRTMDYKPLINASAVKENGVVFGEDPKTIKDLYKRSTPVRVFGKNLKFDYIPFGVIQAYSSTTSASDRVLPSFLTHYRQLYRYSRGSVVLRIINLQDFDNLSCGIQMIADADYYGTGVQMTTPAAVTDASLDERGLGNGSTVSSWNHIQPAEAAIPFFANVFGAPNCFGLSASTEQMKFVRLPSAKVYALGAETDKTTTTHGIVLMECGGDDFELMFQVGPPIILANQL